MENGEWRIEKSRKATMFAVGNIVAFLELFLFEKLFLSKTYRCFCREVPAD